MPRKKESLEERFWRYVTKGDGCWEWQGFRFPRGYGAMSTEHGARAHRVSWIIHNGPIPAGLFVCHRCDNPPCVRPDHLFLGTARDNLLDMVRKGRNPGPERHWRRTRPWLADGANAKYSGTNHWQAVLTDDLVADFRRRAAAGEIIRPLVLSLGLNYQTVCQAIRGITWKHVAVPPVPKRRTHPLRG